jgi:carboxymethylenebutenolidase
LHEFFGLTPSFKEKADRLNEAGFTALVPDLYDGRVASTVDEARSLAQSLDEDTVMARLGAAAEHLTANWHPRLGVVGFSLGAAFAVELAKSRDVEAVALYYGMGEMPGPRWKSPVLGHFAENDEWESHEYIQSFFEALEEIGADAESFVYPGTGHWFANPDVAEAYAPDAAEQAWNRTIDFFSHHLA